MQKKTIEAFGDLRDDEELGPTDWTTVRRYINSLNDADGEQLHPYSLSENNKYSRQYEFERYSSPLFKW